MTRSEISKLETNTQTIERLTRERDDALSKCAEMREALQAIGQCPACGGDGVIHPPCQACLSGEGTCTCANEPAQACPVCEQQEKAVYDKVKLALSDDCGRGYFHARELDRTIELLTELREVCAGIPDGKLWKRFISEEIDRLAELKERKYS